MNPRCIIIGASHAAAQISASLRTEGWTGDILVIGDEDHLPYHRPPLSKSFLMGNKSVDELAIRPAAFYEKNNIDFYSGQVTSIDRHAKTVTLKSGERFDYTKLAICTGARVRKLSFPGDTLNGIHYLRTISDIQAILKHAVQGKRAVLIGGGYIGLETASALNQMGMDVTILEMASRVLHRVTAPQLSAFYTRVHAEEGVTIHTNIAMSEIKGATQVEEVVCDQGMSFPADLVIIGIGVLPNVELAQACGLDVDNGILVDSACRTSDPDIYAAGDCTIMYNTLYQKNLRLESVPNAGEQAKVAASAICDGSKEYQNLPWFWSDQYDLKLQIAGLNEGYDEILIRGDSNIGRSFAVFYLKEGKMIASDCVNRPQEFMLTKRIISQQLSFDRKRLVDENIPVKELLCPA